MRKTISKLFRPQLSRQLPAVPHGERIYAVGDIHGRRDLFNLLIAAIEADDSHRAPADTTIILLGDLVDRGPDSAGVLAAARDLGLRRKVRILVGNHEEMFMRCFRNVELLRHFLRYGGSETVLSYPVDPAQWQAATLAEAQVIMNQVVPASDRAFISTFEDRIVVGDYCFVHAGVAPGVPLAEQRLNDLRWIREPFLSHKGDHEFVVVHGHTITEEPVIRSNRIGIDTGAYMSGQLTALGLEGEERWLLATDEIYGVVTADCDPA